MKWSSQKSILFQVEIIKLCSEHLIETVVETVDKGNGKQAKTADKNEQQYTNARKNGNKQN